MTSIHVDTNISNEMTTVNNNFLDINNMSNDMKECVSDILQLLRQNIFKFYMTFHKVESILNNTNDLSKRVTHLRAYSSYQPEFIRSLKIGQVMLDADILLKKLLHNNRHTELVDIEKQLTSYDNFNSLFANNLTKSGYFIVKPSTYSIVNDQIIISDHANISLKCHNYQINYNGNACIEKLLKKREQLIIQLEEDISNEFNKSLKYQYNELEKLANFGKALTIARIIFDNNIKFNAMNTHYDKIPNEHLLPITSFDTYKTNDEVIYIFHGGIMVEI